MRKIIIDIIVFVVLIATLAFTNVSVGHASAATYYVNPGESIQAAVNAANPGDTIIVRDGTYTENVDVNKQVTIESESGPANCIVQAANPDDDVFAVAANYVIISGFTVQGATGGDSRLFSGICLWGVNHCKISNNKVLNNDFGILLRDSSSNNSISNNFVLSNYEGIGVWFSSSSNDILNNDVSSNYRGIVVWNSGNNNILNNNLSNNGRDAIYFQGSSENIISSNDISNNGFGIEFCGSNKNTISNNNIWNNDRGIDFWSTTNNNTISYNTIMNNNYQGIVLTEASNNNTISNNNIRNNNYYGILLRDTSNNTIYLNNFGNNRQNVYLANSANIWNSTEKISYTYNGSQHLNYMGNYWGDYSGTDADGDGIGDTPYSIGSDADNYPLIEPFENYMVGAPSDTTPPAWPTGSQLAASDITQTSLTLTWTAATDNIGVTAYRIYCNGQQIAEVPGDMLSYQVTDLAPGTQYTFQVQAGDAAGNWSTDGPNATVTTQVAPPVDTTPPETTLTLSGTAGSNGWYTSDVEVNLSAVDNEGGSGVAKTEYSFDGVNWQDYSSSFTLSQEGQTTVYYRSADNAGNVEPTKSQVIKIDKTPSLITVTSPTQGPYLTTDTITIDYEASDTVSGLETATALLDGTEVNNGQTIDLSAMAGSHTFNVVATDQAGNEAAVKLNFEVIIAATTDFKPDSLNVASKADANAATLYIELPIGYSVADIDRASVRLVVNGVEVPAQESPTGIGDYDQDGTSDLMLKFNRAAVIDAVGNTADSVTVAVKGALNDGRQLLGSDVVKVIMPPKKLK
jgi:parallel beta-helix repeat protein